MSTFCSWINYYMQWFVSIDNSGGSGQCTHICFDFRPWYVQAATPPKRIVYLIDTSGAVSTRFLNVAKRIMFLFLKMSNPNDQVIRNNSKYAHIFVNGMSRNVPSNSVPRWSCFGCSVYWPHIRHYLHLQTINGYALARSITFMSPTHMKRYFTI